jgi:hypothetical protein
MAWSLRLAKAEGMIMDNISCQKKMPSVGDN